MFKTYTNKQKGIQEIVKRLLTTAKSMAKQAQLALKSKTQTKANMHLYLLLNFLPPLNRSGSLRLEMTEFVSVDEYLTSQICNKYKSKQLNNISIIGSKRRVHSVSQSSSFQKTFRRLTVLLGFNALSITTVHYLTPR
ncbi:hypothetical protein AB4K20DRAFT_1878842 [Rhizopus microsporus]